jgi:hypothetical protein
LCGAERWRMLDAGPLIEPNPVTDAHDEFPA